MYCGHLSISSAVNLPASRGPRAPAPARAGPSMLRVVADTVVRDRQGMPTQYSQQYHHYRRGAVAKKCESVGWLCLAGSQGFFLLLLQADRTHGRCRQPAMQRFRHACVKAASVPCHLLVCDPGCLWVCAILHSYRSHCGWSSGHMQGGRDRHSRGQGAWGIPDDIVCAPGVSPKGMSPPRGWTLVEGI